jgi:hypothetical protein
VPVLSKSEARALSRREAVERRREAEAVRAFHLYLDEVWEGWQRFEGEPMYTKTAEEDEEKQ